MHLGLKNRLPQQLKQHHKLPGLFGGTGRYAIKETTSDLDELTAVTVTVLMSGHLHDSGNGFSGWSPFSCYYTDGSSNEHGFYLWYYQGGMYAFLGYGATNPKFFYISPNSLHEATTGGAKKDCSYMTYFAFTATAASTSNNLKLYAWNNMAATTSAPTTQLLSGTDSLTWTNWGTLGTNSSVVIGGQKNGSGSFGSAMTDDYVVHRVQMFDSALSQANIEKGIDIAGGHIRPVDYNTGSYTQPIHEWTPTIDSTTISDRGSATGIDLAIQGSADVAYYKEN